MSSWTSSSSGRVVRIIVSIEVISGHISVGHQQIARFLLSIEFTLLCSVTLPTSPLLLLTSGQSNLVKATSNRCGNWDSRLSYVLKNLHPKQDLDPFSRVCAEKSHSTVTDRLTDTAIVCIWWIRCGLKAQYKQLEYDKSTTLVSLLFYDICPVNDSATQCLASQPVAAGV